MSKTFSDEQMWVTKDLLHLQQEIDNRIRNTLQESLLRKDLNKDDLILAIDALRASIDYLVEDKFKQLKRNL